MAEHLAFQPLPELGNPERIANPSCGLSPGAEVHFFLELSLQHPLTEQIDLVGIQLGNLYLLLIGLRQAKLYTLKPESELASIDTDTTNNYNPTRLIHFSERLELKLNTKQGFWIQWASGQISFGYDNLESKSKAIIFDVLLDSQGNEKFILKSLNLKLKF